LDFINDIIENVKKIWPFRIVHSYEQGVRWTSGISGPILKPGIKIFLPGVQSIDTLPITLSPAQFEVDFRTLDGKECTARIGMEYRTEDIKKLFMTVQDGEIAEGLPTLSIIAAGLATGVLSCYSYNDIWDGKEEVEEEMADECNAEFNKKWIEIVDMRIGSLKTTAGYKVFLSQSPKILTEIME